MRDNEDVVGFGDGALGLADGGGVEAGANIRNQGVEAGGDLLG